MGGPDPLREVAGKLVRDPLAQLHDLADVALRRRLRLLRIEHLDVDAAPMHLALEHVEYRAELTLRRGLDGERGRLERDLDGYVLEVVPSRDLAARLVDGVDQLLAVEVADDVEGEFLRHPSAGYLSTPPRDRPAARPPETRPSAPRATCSPRTDRRCGAPLAGRSVARPACSRRSTCAAGARRRRVPRPRRCALPWRTAGRACRRRAPTIMRSASSSITITMYGSAERPSPGVRSLKTAMFRAPWVAKSLYRSSISFTAHRNAATADSGSTTTGTRRCGRSAKFDSSTRFGSMRMSLSWAGVACSRKPPSSALMHTDLPLPVAPVISLCGMPVRSAIARWRLT